MQIARLITELSKLLEVDEQILQRDARLESFDTWDSLTKVTLIGVISDIYGVTLEGSVLDDVATVADIAARVESASLATAT